MMEAIPKGVSISGLQIIQWYLDTRPLWSVPKKGNSKEEVQELRTVASQELSLLSEEEQKGVLKYYHLKDAKMSLASHLLKHFVITKYCQVPWSQSKISRMPNGGKPCFLPSDDKSPSIDFNVSHQAGIVSLIAAIGFKGKMEVGTDVVCVNEREKQDNAYIEKEGFFDWVDMHADVFSEGEVNFMKLAPISLDFLGVKEEMIGYARDAISRCQRRNEVVKIKVAARDRAESEVQIQSNDIIAQKLRRFYACWCLREAYVKMTGEALLAPWLKELEILDVAAPVPKQGVTGDEKLEPGEVYRQFANYLRGKVVKDVKTELQAIGANYMIAGSVHVPKEHEKQDVVFGEWRGLDLKEVLDTAEGNP